MNIKKIFYYFVKKAKSNKLIYNIVHGIRAKKETYKKNNSIKFFQEHGYEALKRFDECMIQCGHQYSLAFGTLLGAIRNNDFIPHDDDIDVAMWISDYTPKLIDDLHNYGIELLYSYSVENDSLGKELTFVYNGVHIDIFFFYKDASGITYCCDFIYQHGCSSIDESIYRFGGLLPRKILLPFSDSFTRTHIKDIEVNIPVNFEEILVNRYGEDYIIPKKGWRPTTSSIIEMPEHICIIERK